jgi:ABC-type Fe3+ transport system permease subunit
LDEKAKARKSVPYSLGAAACMLLALLSHGIVRDVLPDSAASGVMSSLVFLIFALPGCLLGYRAVSLLTAGK